jgi:hypothetical protein
MSVLLFAQGNQITSTEAQGNLIHTWTGWDGSLWLFRQDQGVWLDSDGIRGLGMPDITRYTSTSPSMNGSRNRGYIIAERQVFWPLHIAFTDDLDAAFWRTMLPYETGTWTVQKPNGDQRSLDLRFVDDSQWATAGSPWLLKHNLYGINLVAEQPLWRGAPIIQSWDASPPIQFFGGGTIGSPQLGPPFGISASNDYGSATITNPGDVEAWPKWTMTGPFTSATVGIGGATVTVPFTVASGSSLVIDTSPRVQAAVLNGTTDKTAQLGSVSWASVPPGQDVTLSVSTVGGGSVSAELVPLYLRAW